MSEDVSEIEKASTIEERLLIRGIDQVFLYGREPELKSIITSNYSDILKNRLAFLNISIQMKIVEDMLIQNPETLIEDEFWKSYVKQALTGFSDCEDRHLYENSSWFVLLNRIYDLSEEVDWLDVLYRLSTITYLYSDTTQAFTTVLGWLVQADPENLKTLLYKSETKKYPRSLKKQLYCQLIDLGLLDVKMARRIRSDTSGDLSAQVLDHLFVNRHHYSDEDFSNFVCQFTDTKHKWVARFIALNMPIHLTPFLMGITDKTALTFLEKRLEILDEEENK